ncbi:hypothetical protein [Planococcus faecalis]|nr:hypothetical protein [Planococcus faecalis]
MYVRIVEMILFITHILVRGLFGKSDNLAVRYYHEQFDLDAVNALCQFER